MLGATTATPTKTSLENITIFVPTSTETADYPAIKLVDVVLELRNERKIRRRVLTFSTNLEFGNVTFFVVAVDGKEMYQNLKLTYRPIVFSY